MIFDYPGALRVLVDHEVRFVLIGGLAGVARGAPLITHDLDVCYDRERENLSRLAAALRAMNARLRGAPEDVPFILDAQTLHNGDSFTFLTDYGSVDVLATPSGTRGYPELILAATMENLGDVDVQVVAIDDLIKMKHAAGRNKDRSHLEELIALRDLRTERGIDRDS